MNINWELYTSSGNAADRSHYSRIYKLVKSAKELGLTEINEDVYEDLKDRFSSGNTYSFNNAILNYYNIFSYFGITIYNEFYKTLIPDNLNPRESQIFYDGLRSLIKCREDDLNYNEIEKYHNNTKISNGASFKYYINKYPELFSEITYNKLFDKVIYNHKVISVEYINTYMDVYDLEVDNENHNFSLAAGIIVHNCMAWLHPHGSQDGVVSQLVQEGVFIGQGNHGRQMIYDDDLGASASRYTEAKLDDVYRSQLSKLIKYVPYVVNEMGHKEYAYIPTPIPFALCFGVFGMALGIAVNIPAFTFESLINAHRKQDYRLLEANFDMIIPDKGQLQSLWEDGIGSIVYKYKITKNVTSDDGFTGFLIEGEPGIFKPNWKKLNALQDEGLLIVRDESTDSSKVFVARQKRVSKITDEEIEKLVEKACTSKQSFNIVVTYNQVVRPIGIKDWLNITYGNYVNLVNSYKSDSVKNLMFDRTVWEFLIPAADLMRKDPDMEYDVIAKQIGTSEDVVKVISGKSFGSLHKSNPQEKIDKIDIQIAEINKVNPDKFIDQLEI